jgi:hypothetical protein
MTMIVGWLRGFGRFWYGFIIGDDWIVAATVAVALVVTWLLHAVAVAAWWLPPLAAVAVVGVSLRRAGRWTSPAARRRDHVAHEAGQRRPPRRGVGSARPRGRTRSGHCWHPWVEGLQRCRANGAGGVHFQPGTRHDSRHIGETGGAWEMSG